MRGRKKNNNFFKYRQRINSIFNFFFLIRTLQKDKKKSKEIEKKRRIKSVKQKIRGLSSRDSP